MIHDLYKSIDLESAKPLHWSVNSADGIVSPHVDFSVISDGMILFNMSHNY